MTTLEAEKLTNKYVENHFKNIFITVYSQGKYSAIRPELSASGRVVRYTRAELSATGRVVWYTRRAKLSVPGRVVRYTRAELSATGRVVRYLRAELSSILTGRVILYINTDQAVHRLARLPLIPRTGKTRGHGYIVPMNNKTGNPAPMPSWEMTIINNNYP